jgi:hypothetical protein
VCLLHFIIIIIIISLVAYSYTPNPLSGTALRVFEFDPSFKLDQGDGSGAFGSGNGLNKKRWGGMLEYTIKDVFGLFHDFVVTKNLVAFTVSPQSLGDLKTKALDLLLGFKSPGEAIEFDESKPSQFYVFRRDGSAVVVSSVVFEILKMLLKFVFISKHSVAAGLIFVTTCFMTDVFVFVFVFLFVFFFFFLIQGATAGSPWW